MIATFRNNSSLCESSLSCAEIQGGMKRVLRQESGGPGEPRACWASTFFLCNVEEFNKVVPKAPVAFGPQVSSRPEDPFVAGGDGR